MQPDGTYVRGAADGARSSQQVLIELAEKRQKEASRRRKRRPQGLRAPRGEMIRGASARHGE